MSNSSAHHVRLLVTVTLRYFPVVINSAHHAGLGKSRITVLLRDDTYQAEYVSVCIQLGQLESESRTDRGTFSWKIRRIILPLGTERIYRLHILTQAVSPDKHCAVMYRCHT
jgi:hypothetical protein